MEKVACPELKFTERGWSGSFDQSGSDKTANSAATGKVKVSVRRSVPSRATCEGRHPETFTMAVDLLLDRPTKNGMPRREGLTE
jgi:hypothetical protein